MQKQFTNGGSPDTPGNPDIPDMPETEIPQPETDPVTPNQPPIRD